MSLEFIRHGGRKERGVLSENVKKVTKKFNRKEEQDRKEEQEEKSIGK